MLTTCPQKLALTSPTSGGRSVGIVHSLTQTMEFSLVLVHKIISRPVSKNKANSILSLNQQPHKMHLSVTL
jgi:hypothetical protein